jgi:lysozyme
MGSGGVIDELLADLKRDEGLRLKPYYDTAIPPRLTIGYGRNLDDVGISEEEAEFLLRNDVDRALDALDRAMPWWREQPAEVQRALANMAFNLGLTRLLGFRRMLAALKAGDREGAAREAMSSRWATQVGARADRIAKLIRGDG